MRVPWNCGLRVIFQKKSPIGKEEKQVLFGPIQSWWECCSHNWARSLGGKSSSCGTPAAGAAPPPLFEKPACLGGTTRDGDRRKYIQILGNFCFPEVLLLCTINLWSLVDNSRKSKWTVSWLQCRGVGYSPGCFGSGWRRGRERAAAFWSRPHCCCLTWSVRERGEQCCPPVLLWMVPGSQCSPAFYPVPTQPRKGLAIVWGIHLCWPEQAKQLLKVLRVDLNSSKELCQGGGFDCTCTLGWCWAAVPNFQTHRFWLCLGADWLW